MKPYLWMSALLMCATASWSAEEPNAGMAKRFLEACFANDQRAFQELWVGQAELIAINGKLGGFTERGVESKLLNRDLAIANGHKALVRYLQANAISREMVSGEKALFPDTREKGGFQFARDGYIEFSAQGKTYTVQIDEAVLTADGRWKFYWEPKRLHIRTDPKTVESIRLDR